ncbi:UDP-glucose--hexose-1-phosphate uridylyltransferase [Clostridium sp. SYSU_GA19001]|uniref:UDP-glucose--hexose-1-phosphate uridylyltransferase n=1 Tax=Clostridium caldaquaticum TaxID=2940653 RepID=UPI002077704D|nr:UDP-glucose--hexose-1-phosphate uridylyltransferase [Clostridium caldaquaticum]MCM8710090.1 UDP-glucose--hexose-1-phosphate uridylyltransferase [Clostridium caldaquaticum]
MKNINAAFEIERLINFAVQHKIIEELDVIFMRNQLMDLLKVDEPYEGDITYENLNSPVEILENLLDYAWENKLIEDNTLTYRDLFDTKIMGILMPRQSDVVRSFYKTYNEKGKEAATNDFYAISQASNYIRMDRIAKNLYWEAPTEYGVLEITVNLSKPEKDPKEIAASKLRPQSNYPKCLLCIENVGFAGHVNHPARQNHRVIPVTLSGEQWYFQYSPYVYYNEHCILFNSEHIPMKISNKTFERLLDFIEKFPHYFIGSNADLPIVGGSILSHDHFQGGKHVFPMEKAPIELSFTKDNSKVNLGIVKWPMSVIRISSKDKEELIKQSVEILETWRDYSDEALDILAYSEVNGEKVPHNTITPIARMNKAGEFELDLVLRNNRTNSDYPDGIFHPHEELHHIKKENIGLIEVMGLAVLPGRLNTELKEAETILQGDKNRLKAAEENADDSIHKHAVWIKAMAEKYGTNCSSEKAEEVLKKEVGNKFLQVLIDAGVYKRNKEGQEGFVKLIESLGFKNNLIRHNRRVLWTY